MPDEFGSLDASPRFVGPPWFEAVASWIKSHARAFLFVAVVFQLLVLLSMIAIHSAPLVFGERILLRVRPVDPRDFFRGDYVILSYDFSRLPPGGVPGMPVKSSWRRGWNDDAWLADRTVYVSLQPAADGKHYQSAGVSLERPTTGPYLRGAYSPGFGNQLQFGIEAYYVQEGEGKLLEQQRNAGNLSAEIALAPWGQAALCRLK
jgi:uncharacterized membrane-anchored protein